MAVAQQPKNAVEHRVLELEFSLTISVGQLAGLHSLRLLGFIAWTSLPFRHRFCPPNQLVPLPVVKTISPFVCLPQGPLKQLLGPGLQDGLSFCTYNMVLMDFVPYLMQCEGTLSNQASVFRRNICPISFSEQNAHSCLWGTKVTLVTFTFTLVVFCEFRHLTSICKCVHMHVIQ